MGNELSACSMSRDGKVVIPPPTSQPEAAPTAAAATGDALLQAAKITEKENAIKELEKEKQKLQGQLAELQKFKTDATAKFAEQKKLQDEKGALQNELETLKGKTSKNEAKIAELTKAIETKEQQIKRLGTQTGDEAKRALIEAQDKINQLQSQQSELETLAEQLVALKPLIAESEKSSQFTLSKEFVEAFQKFKEVRDKKWLEQHALERSGLGEVQTMLTESYQLKIRVSGCDSLPAGDNKQARNPYAAIKVMDIIKKSAVVQKSRTPKWNEEFTFTFDSAPTDVRIDIWDFDEKKNDGREVIGSVTISLAPFYKLNSNPVKTDTVPLQSGVYNNAGTVTFTIDCRAIPVTIQRWGTGYAPGEIAKLLQFAGVNVNSPGIQGRTPLMDAAMKNQANAVRSFILAKANVNEKNTQYEPEMGMTALMYAASYGNIDVVEVLIEEGHADVNLTDAVKRTALMWAARIVDASTGALPVIKKLVEYKAQIEAVDNDSMTAVMHAALQGHADVVQYFVEQKADISRINKMNMNCLMLATVRDHTGVMEKLLKAKVDPNVPDVNGMTPLIVASLRGHAQNVKLLISHNAAIDQTDARKRTALMYAAFQGWVEVVSSLLEAGAKVDLADKDGRTAAMFAKDAGRNEAFELLNK